MCESNSVVTHPEAAVEVRRSGIHGQGLFARRFIPAGARVIEYRGERIDKRESARRCAAGNHFIFSLDEEWDLDGNVPDNPAAFANHSCAPNCEAEQEGHRIWLVALRDIAPDEEITFNYGYDLEDFREHPCACGAPQCVGYIVAEELIPALRRKLTGESPNREPARESAAERHSF